MNYTDSESLVFDLLWSTPKECIFFKSKCQSMSLVQTQKLRVDVNKQYIDSKFITLAKSLDLLETKLEEFVKLDVTDRTLWVLKTGDKLSGEIDMDGYRISNIGNPTNDEDAVNLLCLKQQTDVCKRYVRPKI